MVCDELWEYEESDHLASVATLVGLRILCPQCNLARHFGFAGSVHKNQEALATLIRVNEIGEVEAKAMQEHASTEWMRLSQQRWRVDVSAPLLLRYPDLEVLVGLKGRSRFTDADDFDNDEF